MGMTKKELVADMKKSVNGSSFIIKSDLMKYLGVGSHHTIEKYVNDLERINGRYYFIPDVAESMLRLGGVK